MTTSLDLKNVIQLKMRQNNIPAARVADASGYTTSDLSRWFNGKLALTNDQAKHIYTKVIEIEKLIAAVYPLPIDFRRADTIRDILGKISDKELEFSVKNPTLPARVNFTVGGLTALVGAETTFVSACQNEITERANQLLSERTTYRQLQEIQQ